MGVAWQSLLFLALALLVENQGSVLRSSLEEDYVKRPRTNEQMQPLNIFKRDTRNSEDDLASPVVQSGFGFNKNYLERIRRYAKCGRIPKEPEYQEEEEGEEEDAKEGEDEEYGNPDDDIKTIGTQSLAESSKADGMKSCPPGHTRIKTMECVVLRKRQ